MVSKFGSVPLMISAVQSVKPSMQYFYLHIIHLRLISHLVIEFCEANSAPNHERSMTSITAQVARPHRRTIGNLDTRPGVSNQSRVRVPQIQT